MQLSLVKLCGLIGFGLLLAANSYRLALLHVFLRCEGRLQYLPTDIAARLPMRFVSSTGHRFVTSPKCRKTLDLSYEKRGAYRDRLIEYGTHCNIQGDALLGSPEAEITEQPNSLADGGFGKDILLLLSGVHPHAIPALASAYLGSFYAVVLFWPAGQPLTAQKMVKRTRQRIVEYYAKTKSAMEPKSKPSAALHFFPDCRVEAKVGGLGDLSWKCAVQTIFPAIKASRGDLFVPAMKELSPNGVLVAHADFWFGPQFGIGLFKESLWVPKKQIMNRRQKGWMWRDSFGMRLVQKKILADVLGQWPDLEMRLQHMYCDLGGWDDMFYVPSTALQHWIAFGQTLITSMNKMKYPLLNELAVPWIHTAVAEIRWQEYRKSQGSPMFIEERVNKKGGISTSKYNLKILTSGIQVANCVGGCCSIFPDPAMASTRCGHKIDLKYMANKKNLAASMGIEALNLYTNITYQPVNPFDS